MSKWVFLDTLRPNLRQWTRPSYCFWWWQATGHYLNQWWLIAIRTLRNKLQWKFSRKQLLLFKKIHLITSSAKNVAILDRLQCLDKLGPIQNGRQFADDIFKCISHYGMQKTAWVCERVLYMASTFLNTQWQGNIFMRWDNMSALFQIKAWRRTGDKPLSDPMITQLTDAYMRHSDSRSLDDDDDTID